MKSHRLSNLDGLRGIAALAVMCEHLSEYYVSLAPAGDPVALGVHALTMKFLNFGKLGVVAFFAISGFIVPNSFHTSKPRTAFLISRFFRLYPAYWISMLLAALYLPLVGPVSFSVPQVIANLSMVQMLLHQKDVLAVYWTLFIEILFYGMCMLAFSFGALRSPRQILGVFSSMLALALVGAVIRARGSHTLPAAIPLYLSIMWWASCVRLNVLESNEQAGRLARWMLGMIVVAVPVVWCIAYADDTHKSNRLSDIMGFYAGLALFLVCIRYKAFGVRPLVYAGGISYSVYLFHELALETGRVAAQGLEWPLSGIVLIAVVFITAIGVSHLVFTYVEKPSIRLGKRIIQARTGPTLEKPVQGAEKAA